MRNLFFSSFRGTTILLLVILSFSSVSAQQGTGGLRGTVKDQFGGTILGATITVVDTNGAEKTVTTDDEGIYTISGLAPGKYVLKAVAPGFASFENADVDVSAGRREAVDITMEVTIAESEVSVAAETPVSTDPENNGSALVLKEGDLDALPDDPDDLAAALQALAGPSAGPNGGQIFVDGFTGGRMPPKEAIREIRINQNPFAAENDRPGGGRIEILTRPGTERYRGSASFSFNDESLNSRNPFAPRRAPFQVRSYSGNFSGPIIKKKSSFFLDFDRRETDDNEIINAIVLDPTTTAPTSFRQVLLQPRRTLSFSPRFDYALNTNNTLVARYSYSRNALSNQGLNNFTLPERAYTRAFSQHTVQLTETAILTPTIINETRFQFNRQQGASVQFSDSTAINVRDAFVAGGAQLGVNQNTETRWELQNYTTWAKGTHSLKGGIRLRGIRISDISEQNFGGTFVFNSIGQYQRALQYQNAGLSPEDLRTLDALPSQFTLNSGEPAASVSQVDFGGFIQDDWRARQNLTLSFGLRYENQSNIDSNFNFGPRVAFAWSPGGGGATPSKTVIRGGVGLFYERLSEDLTLRSIRFNGVGQQNYVVSNGEFIDPAVLALLARARFSAAGQVTNVPTAEDVVAAGIASRAQTTYRVAPDAQAPYSIFYNVSVERQLPARFVVTTYFSSVHTRHQLRARNINAQLFTTDPNGDLVSYRPLAPAFTGDLYQYETSGRFDLDQLAVSVNNRLSPRIMIFSNYVLSKARNDTDGSGTFPANQYDVSGEYGRSGSDARHRFFFGGSVSLPWYGISLNPFITANSGTPFNITTGIDNNGDRLFTDRPAFATEATLPENLRVTPYGNFDIRPAAGSEIIPRNFAQGPGFFSANLRVNKTWSFGDLPGTAAQAATGQQDSQGAGNNRGGGGRRGGGGGGIPRVPGGGGIGGGGGRGGRGGFFGGMGGGRSAEKRYALTLSVNFDNLFNNVNLSSPVGNLSSSLFGQSVSTRGGFGFGGGGNPAAGNRRITAQLRFSF